MPDSTTPKSIDLAEAELLFGHAGSQNRLAFRWSERPATAPLNDFEKLMCYLYSDHTETSAKYLADSRATQKRVVPPETKLDRIKAAWERILPHRRLLIGGLKIETSTVDLPTSAYKSSEMSDGERVVFYLIGQCLAAPADGVIVIDEPELHLHKSIQTPLWSEVERLRPDCLFVYLTHDVDFAAAKHDATKVWLKSFDGMSWDWEVLQPNADFPEDLLLEILGSRKPIAFVEGVSSSFDFALYSMLLPRFLVIPVGGCDEVIKAVKGLSAQPQLHHVTAVGIIDRDRRESSEISSLQKQSIYVLDVAEVENLFCVEEIVKLVSKHLARDADQDFSAASTRLFSRLNAELQVQISSRVGAEASFQLNQFDARKRGAAALSSELARVVGQVDIGKIYAAVETDFRAVITSGDYRKLMKLYNRKSLFNEVGSCLGLANNQLPELVIRLANGDLRKDIVEGIRHYFGPFGTMLG